MQNRIEEKYGEKERERCVCVCVGACVTLAHTFAAATSSADVRGRAMRKRDAVVA